jgi:hypothetical protein
MRRRENTERDSERRNEREMNRERETNERERSFCNLVLVPPSVTGFGSLPMRLYFLPVQIQAWSGKPAK